MNARQLRGDRRKARPGAWAAVAAVLLSVLPGTAQANERVALVIGNGAYAPHAPNLPNPKNDAAGVGAALTRLGFEVTRLDDAGYQDLRLGLLEFEEEAARSEVAVVFYAGHGIEIGGENYLVPVDAKLRSDRAVKHEAMRLAQVMESVEGASKFRLVILDACRNNPFLAKMTITDPTRAVGQRGLARVEPSKDTLVAYAAKEGTTADDGKGDHSPYTEALLLYLEEPGLEVGFMFRKVRDAVWESTGKSQLPYTYGSLSSDGVYLAGKGPSLPDGTAAKVAYEAAKEVGTVAALQAVVKRFPDTFGADLAQAQIDKLKGDTPEEVEKELGLSGETKRLVQMGLAAAGHDPGGVDGVLEGLTRDALRSWQGSKRMEVTGYLTREQSERLAALGREESERRRVLAEREPGIYLTIDVLVGQKIDSSHLQAVHTDLIPLDEIKGYSMVRGGCYHRPRLAGSRLGWDDVALGCSP